MSRALERTILLIALAVFVVGFFFIPSPTVKNTELVIKTKTAYIAPGHVFGLNDVRNIVSSPFYYESSLVNYSIPVADSDYILPYGSNERVHLPGWSNDKYRFIRTGYISGSGWFETWQVPNGGYIAFLHLSAVEISASVRASFAPKPPNASNIEEFCKAFTGDKNTSKKYNAYCLNGDRTGLVVNQLISQGLPQTSGVTHTGGYQFGTSGWPTDPYFGNGDAGPSNAHLCVVYDEAGAQWLYYVTTQPKPKPAPFDFKLWYKWHLLHKTHNISPYYGKHLTAIAHVWYHHTKECGSVIANWVYNSKDRYTYQKFQGCTIFVWTHKGYKPKIVKHKWVT